MGNGRLLGKITVPPAGDASNVTTGNSFTIPYSVWGIAFETTSTEVFHYVTGNDAGLTAGAEAISTQGSDRVQVALSKGTKDAVLSLYCAGAGGDVSVYAIEEPIESSLKNQEQPFVLSWVAGGTPDFMNGMPVPYTKFFSCNNVDQINLIASITAGSADAQVFLLWSTDGLNISAVNSVESVPTVASGTALYTLLLKSWLVVASNDFPVMAAIPVAAPYFTIATFATSAVNPGDGIDVTVILSRSGALQNPAT